MGHSFSWVKPWFHNCFDGLLFQVYACIDGDAPVKGPLLHSSHNVPAISLNVLPLGGIENSPYFWQISPVFYACKAMRAAMSLLVYPFQPDSLPPFCVLDSCCRGARDWSPSATPFPTSVAMSAVTCITSCCPLVPWVVIPLLSSLGLGPIVVSSR